MNFEELQNEWDAENNKGILISENMLKIEQAHLPIDIIRKKMKHEFGYQLVALLFMLSFPYLFHLSHQMSLVFLSFYAITCGFIAHYFYKFYRFYKNSYDMGMDSRKSILWFFYEMKLNIELYKALTYIIAFIWIAFIAIYLLIEKTSITHKILERLSPFYILLNCFITIIIIGIITEMWAWYYYGKYLKSVGNVVDELDYE